MFNVFYLVAHYAIKWKKKRLNLKNLDPSKQGKLMKKFIGIKATMEYNWYLRFISAGFIKIATFSFLQILNLSFVGWPYIVSSCFAIFGCLLVLVFPFYLIILI